MLNLVEWLNPPPDWSQDGDTIQLTCAPDTDFWRKTWDNGERDSGHFYFEPVAGDFVLDVKVSGDYGALYDQAGAMVRIDQDNWMKCGVELLHGVQQISAVVTRGASDWSVQPLNPPPPFVYLRVRRQDITLEVEYSLDGSTYTLIRQAFFPSGPAMAGVMACAPKGEGFRATFEGLSFSSV